MGWPLLSDGAMCFPVYYFPASFFVAPSILLEFVIIFVCRILVCLSKSYYFTEMINHSFKELISIIIDITIFIQTKVDSKYKNPSLAN